MRSSFASLVKVSAVVAPRSLRAASTTPSSHDPRWYLAAFPANMSMGISAPLVPLILLLGLGGGPAEVALAAAVTSLAGVPASALWGRLSDRSGKRRRFVVLGYAGFGAGMLLVGLAPSVPFVLLGALLLGLLGTAASAAGPALIMESSPDAEWARRIAEFSRVCSSGWLAGLLIGAAWLYAFHDVAGLRALAVLSSILGLVGAVGASIWISESGKGSSQRPSVDVLLRLDAHAIERYRYLPSRMLHFRFWREEARVLRAAPGRHPLLMLLAALTLLFTGFVLFYTVLPAYLALAAGAGAGPIFIVFAASSAASTVFYPWAGRVVDHVGGRRAILVAATVRVPLFLTFPLVLFAWHGSTAIVMFAALNALAGICWTCISVGSTVAVTELSPTSKAEAVGAFHAVQGIGAIAGAGLAAALVVSIGFSGLIALSASLVFAGVMLTLGSRLRVPQVATTGSPDS